MADYEPRHCFIEQGHDAHDWNVDLKDQDIALPDVLHFHCDGSNIERNPWDENTGPGSEDEDPWGPAELVASVREQNTPAILDARTAYGDKVQNQVEQAAMINAYLSGRTEIRPVDVPVIFMLVKAHRLGKMPDYADNFNDIEGYLSIARLVVGPDMIEATTAKEYMEIKEARRKQPSQVEGRMIDHHQNPYRNVERDDVRTIGLDEKDDRL